MTTKPDPNRIPPEGSWAEHIRVAFRDVGQLDVKAVAEDRFGDSSKKHMMNIQQNVYQIRKSIENEHNKKMIYQNEVYKLIPNEEAIQETGLSSSPVTQKTRSKTAVLVVREVREDGTARYEIDVVGEFNRGMMKEALKQLMEVFI